MTLLRLFEMKNKIPFKLIFSSAILSLFLVFGCVKDEDGPEEPEVTTTTTGSTTPQSNFKWTEGGASTSTTADSSVCYVQITTLYAFKNGTVNTVEINLSDIGPGQYNISSVSGNELKYVRNGATFIAKSGLVTITSNSNGRISGNYSTAFSVSSPSGLSGEFSDVKMR